MNKIELLLELWIYGPDFTSDLLCYIKDKFDNPLYDYAFDEIILSNKQEQHFAGTDGKVEYSVEELADAILIYYPKLNIKKIAEGVQVFVATMEESRNK